MKFSRPKILVFFTAIIILGWFLYPRALFLGFIYEGTAELEKAEAFYQNYLVRRPLNKFATLRLIALYERMGTPEKGAPLMAALYAHRIKDWSVASRYMDHLENIHAEAHLQQLRIEIAKNFMESPLFPKGRILIVLEDALNFALWNQNTEEAYAILSDILKITRRRDDFLSLKADLDRGLKKSDAILAYLEGRLSKDPNDTEIRQEISQTYEVLGQEDRALSVLQEGLVLDPDNKYLLKARVLLFVKLKKYEEAVTGLQNLLAAKDLHQDERAALTEDLAFIYNLVGETEQVRLLYDQAIHSDSFSMEDRITFINRLDIFYQDQKKPDQVLKLYEEVLAMESIPVEDKYDFVDKLAYLYSKQGRREEVIGLYKKVLAHENLPTEMRSELYDKLIYDFIQAGNMEEAQFLYFEAIREKAFEIANKLHFVDGLASFFSDRGEIIQILPVYQEALKWNLEEAQRVVLMEQMAYVYAKTHQQEKLIKLYQEGIGLKTLSTASRIQFLENLVDLFSKSKRFAEILGLYKGALSWTELNSKDRYNLVDQLVFVHTKLGHDEDVVALYQNAIQSSQFEPPEATNLIKALAEFYVKKNKDRKEDSKIEDLYLAALTSNKLDKDSQVQFMDALAEMYGKQNRLDDSLALYTKALRITGQPLQVRTQLVTSMSDVYHRMGAVDKFESLYQEILGWEDLSSKQRFDFVEAFAFYYTKSKSPNLVLRLYQRVLDEMDLDKPEKISVMTLLAEAYAKQKDLKEAESLYRRALELDDENPDNWLNLVYFLDHLKRTDEQIDLMKHYLSRFPSDRERIKFLIELYLYVKKDTSQMPLYYSLMRRSPDESIAMGVTDLLLKNGQVAEAIKWAEANAVFFPMSPALPKLIIDHFIQSQHYEMALGFTERLLKRMPHQPHLLAQAALLHAMRGNAGASKAYFSKLDAALPKKFDTLHWIGREAFFAGKNERALFYLSEASKLNPDDAANWYWLGEVQFSEGRQAEAIRAMRRANSLFKKEEGLEASRMQLKTQGRIHFDANIEERYFSKIRKYPHEAQFYEDLMDFFLEKKNGQKVASLLKAYQKAFPKESKKGDLYEAQLAAVNRDWNRAIQIGRHLVSKNPEDVGLKYTLASFYYDAGRFRSAIKTYEEITRLSPEEKRALEPLKYLYSIYDDRVTADYSMGFFGADDFSVGTLRYASFISSYKLMGEIETGYYHATATNFRDLAEKGLFVVERSGRVALRGGLGFGISPSRKTPSAVIGLKINQPAYNVSFNFDYRKLRTDFPQAVSAGTLEDQASVEGQMNWRRLSFYGQYKFRRDYLPDGTEAREHFFEPGFSFEILATPHISVGYHFSFQEVTADNGFLAQVPLLTQLRSHIFLIDYYQPIGKNFSYGVSFFMGEDTARNTHLFEGDLFGSTATFSWNVLNWLDLGGTYSFGREGLANIGGTSHQFGVTLSGHWN